MTRITRWVLAVAALISLAVQATAAPTYYTTRAAFNAAAGALANFESFEALPQESLPSPTITFPNLRLTETNGTNLFTSTIVNTIFTSATTHGNHSVWYDDNDLSVSTLELTVVPTANAIGLDIATALDSVVTIGGDANAVLNLTANTPKFFGVIDLTGTIDTLTFDASGGPEVGFDAVAFGTTVPEPQTVGLVLLSTALASILRLGRRVS